jgi:NADPH2:quinone reductase
LLQRGRLREGESVLVHGAAGGIGIAAIQVAKAFGAKVIATAGSEAKRRACLEEGADHATDYHSGFIDQVKAGANQSCAIKRRRRVTFLAG